MSILCKFFGHKPGKHILAYSIDGRGTFYRVTMFDVIKCARCGEIYTEVIDSYERYAFNASSAIHEKEKNLRSQQLVSLFEAYAILGKGEFQNEFYQDDSGEV